MNGKEEPAAQRPTSTLRKLLASLRVKAGAAAVALVLGLVALTGSIVIRHERLALTREVELRVLSQARSIAASSERVMLEPDPELTFQKVLREMMARDPDIKSIVVVDAEGVILAHPRVTKIGTRYAPEEGLTPVVDPKAVAPGETIAEGPSSFVVSTPIVRTFEGEVREIGRVYISSSKGKIEKAISAARMQILFIAFLVSVLGSIAAVILSGFIVKPIKKLAAGARRIGEGDLNVRVAVPGRDEIGQLAATLNEMAARLAIAREELVEQQRIARELEIARDIQQSFLPRHLPEVAQVDVAAVCRSATEVGGDYFDLIPLDARRIGVAIADVAGKGVPGLLVMAVVRTVLRAEARTHVSPREVLIRANDIIAPDIRRGMFVTVLYGVLDVARRTFTFANAGHNPLVVVRKEGAIPYEVIKTQGRPVGFMLGAFFDDRLEEMTVMLEEGDVLFAYTDGVLDAYNEAGEQFGTDRLLEILTERRGAAPQELVDEVVARLTTFVGGQPQQDDITLVAVALKPQPTEMPPAEPVMCEPEVTAPPAG